MPFFALEPINLNNPAWRDTSLKIAGSVQAMTISRAERAVISIANLDNSFSRIIIEETSPGEIRLKVEPA